MINKMLVWEDKLITKCLPLDLHMSGDVLARYLKERVLKEKQILACVSNPPKKPAIRGKIKPLGSQKVGHESGHPKVTWLKYLIVPLE
jgi:hypothetical protein